MPNYHIPLVPDNTYHIFSSAVGSEKIFREDLLENPNNHWALYGLYQSLLKQKKNAAAVTVKKQFDKAFEGADITAGAIIF